MAIQVYKPANKISPPTGWKVIATAPDNSNGYFAAAFANGNRVVIAHRGTDLKNLATLKADLQIAGRNVPDQYTNAKKFVSQVMANSQKIASPVYFQTGHSLGAILAELAAAEFNTNAVTFESPGSRPIIQKMASGAQLKTYLANADAKVSTYNAAPNMINTVNGHVGTLYRIYPACDAGGPHTLGDYDTYTKQQHSIDEIVKLFSTASGMPTRSDKQTWWPDAATAVLCFVAHPCSCSQTVITLPSLPALPSKPSWWPFR
jgi:hypothetical protein